jgi:hypothetical protein
MEKPLRNDMAVTVFVFMGRARAGCSSNSILYTVFDSNIGMPIEYNRLKSVTRRQPQVKMAMSSAIPVSFEPEKPGIHTNATIDCRIIWKVRYGYSWITVNAASSWRRQRNSERHTSRLAKKSDWIARALFVMIDVALPEKPARLLVLINSLDHGWLRVAVTWEKPDPVSWIS